MANATPAFPRNGKFVAARVTAANTSSQGGGTIGTDIFLLGSAASPDGTFVRFVRFVPTATTPTTTTATVGRVFISTQSSGATTSATTFLIGEVTLPATAADNATNAAPFFDVPINQWIANGNNILITNHAAPAANTAWIAIAYVGDM
jgi:hypothetical protein